MIKFITLPRITTLRFSFGLFTKKKKTPEQEHHDTLNQEYQNYKKNRFSKIYEPKSASDQFMSKKEIDKQHKETIKEIDDFLKEYKFNRDLDVKRFIKIISQVSYTMDNAPIIQLERFRDLIITMSELSHKFTDSRDLCLFMNFCNMHQVKLPDVWFSFSSYVKNNYRRIPNSEKLLILSSTNEENKEDFLPLFEIFESYFLEELKQEKAELGLIFQVLEVYRAYDQGSESFFYTIKCYILENIKEMKIPVLVQLLMYFATSTKESLENRKEFLDAIEDHLFKIAQFLNRKELLQVLYAYVKTGNGSNTLFELLERRSALLVDEMNLGEWEALLIIGANKEFIKKRVFGNVEGQLKKKLNMTRSKDVVQIALLFIENELGSEEFINKLEDHIIPSMHNIDIDEMSDLIYALMCSKVQLKLSWIERISDVILSRVEEMNIKQLCQVVWLTSDYFKSLKQPGKSKLVEVYEQIEKRLIKLCEEGDLDWKKCGLILNAYVQNLPISVYVLRLMEAFIQNNEIDESVDCWELTTIAWGYSYVDDFEVKDIMEKIKSGIEDRIDEMNINELLTSLRAYVVLKMESKLMVEQGIQKIEYWIDMINSLDQLYMGLYVFSNTQHKNVEGLGQILSKIYTKIQLLKSLTDQSSQDRSLDLAAQEYEARESLNNKLNQ